MSANTDEQISTNAELDGSVSQSKSKRKGEGRWTRIERACERCKKMKTRVFISLHTTNEVSVMRRGRVIIVEGAVINVPLKNKLVPNVPIWRKDKLGQIPLKFLKFGRLYTVYASLMVAFEKSCDDCGTTSESTGVD